MKGDPKEQSREAGTPQPPITFPSGTLHRSDVNRARDRSAAKHTHQKRWELLEHQLRLPSCHTNEPVLGTGLHST